MLPFLCILQWLFAASFLEVMVFFQFFQQMPVYPVFYAFISNPYGVLYSLGIGCTVAYYANAIYAKERGAAIFCVVSLLLYIFKRTFCKQVAHLGRKACHYLVPEHI